MALAAGTRLGIYEITGHLGTGGMGEVYRARDTKLGRDVAIKTLPSALAKEPDRLARFEREAKLLATLNHAHIAAIYGLHEHEGTQFLAMELVEGETLAKKVVAGALPVEDALRLALQIAEALEAAHEKGVVHRDLKPANVMVTANGQVKVLDFGLAKAFAGNPGEASPAHSPALSMAMTQQGLILGTAGYMAPEQASGQATDQRADVWAFGVLLYEMLTGLPLFRGESVPHILADVLRAPPDWTRLPKNLHPRIHQLLERCLAKKPRNRYSGIADARVDIEAALGDPRGVTPERAADATRPTSSSVLRLAAAAAVAAGIAGAAAWLLLPEPAREVSRAMLTPPASTPFTPAPDVALAISPDGRRVIYRGRLSGEPRLFVRDLAELDARPLSGPTGEVRNLFFSPDGQSIGFSDGNALYRVSIFGGPPLMITTLDGAPRGATWGPDDTIVFATVGTAGLQRVPAGGGTPEALTTIADSTSDQIWPEYLPDGNAVLFTIQAAGTPDADQIAVLSLADRQVKALIGGTGARYVPTGHLVYNVGDTLRAVGFDPSRLELTTNPVPIVEDVTLGPVTGLANFGVARNGSLVYARGSQVADEVSLVWINSAGEREPLPFPPAAYNWPRVSPDGTQVTVTIDNQDVWVGDIARGTLSRVTTTSGVDNVPIWTPDGERVVFASLRDGTGRFSFFAQSADGTGAAEKLLTSPGVGNFKPYTWSPDGARLVFDYGQPARLDIGVLEMDGSGNWQPLLSSEANEAAPALSPDGHWIAYSSDQSGNCEIYVEKFPELGSRRQISTAGGGEAVWSPDGDELYYREGARLMSVTIDTESGFTAGSPKVLIDGLSAPACVWRDYDVSPDSQRFLVLQRSVAAEGIGAPEIVLVQNWLEELKRLVPTE